MTHARLATLVAALFLTVVARADANTSIADRPPTDEIIYFVLPDRFENGDPSNDRGGLEGGRLEHGFDPTDKGFYHGGDLKGLTQRLDYIEGLGATAIWLGPIYKNRAVSGSPGFEKAGYHGYWVTDFTTVDPHFGTKADLKDFVDAAHARGIKIYLDIITNHTADVIKYRECDDPEYDGADKQDVGCPYRSIAEYPFSTRGDVSGEPINQGFLGVDEQHLTADNFKHLTRPDYAYTPYVPAGQETLKKPDWLNDLIYYNNRGSTTFEGENSIYGDFIEFADPKRGLDDLMTEHPVVVDGFVEIFSKWISDYRIDGFRVDTAKHVNPEFWRQFVPAIKAHAATEGVPQFYIFGEVFDFDPAGLARFTHVDEIPTVLDFAFQSAVADVIAGDAPTSRFTRLFNADALYAGGVEAAGALPIFVGNHDIGRFSGFVEKSFPEADENEKLKRVILAHATMFFLRGVPVIYYGDEQGFVSDGSNRDARENMFPSKVDSFNDNNLLGVNSTTAQSNFDPSHPIYRAIREMAKQYRKHEALRNGRQVIRLTETDGGVAAFSRIDSNGREYLIVFNTRNETRDVHIAVDGQSEKWDRVIGECPKRSAAVGSVKMSLKPFAYSVCLSNRWKSLK